MTLRGVRVNRKLFDILTNYGPKAFGPLYMPSVLQFPNDPGFYKVLGPSEEDAPTIQDQKNTKLVAYMDKNIAPPLHFFHHQEATAEVSEKTLVGGLMTTSFTKRETLLSSFQDTAAIRVLNGRRDGVPGITIDFYTKKHALVAVTSGYWLANMNEVIRYVLEYFPAVQSIRLVDQVERAGKRNYSGKVIWKAEGTLPPSDCHVKEVRMYLAAFE
jgi:23S rRNA G2069 N7-methylase RlmK/C1962 C5-methylase RlmI